MLLLDVALVVVGLALLFYGGESLVKGAARLASALGISPTVIGLTVVAFGTSVPELLVSISAALRGSSDIALGNVLGSNIANIGLILGMTAVIYPLTIEWALIRREIPIMIGVSLAALALAFDGELSRLDGVLLFAGFVAFTAASYFLARADQRAIEPEIAEYDRYEGITPALSINRRNEGIRLVVGIALLALGAQLTVEGAAALARAAGIPEIIIGITLVAFGTSLPELSASVVAALRRETDIAFGNALGSNITNILLILGTTALTQPIPVAAAQLHLEFPLMIGFAVLLLPFVLNRKLVRHEGIVFLLAYMGFITLTFVR